MKLLKYDFCQYFEVKIMYNLQLKENFKIFISGPSRCGKTFFFVDLLQNLFDIAKTPPKIIIYIYKIWQWKFDEMKTVNIFLKDNDDVIDKLKQYARGMPILVIFDDMINSKSINDIAPLFTVDARHMNMSLIFLSQRIFVNNEYFRQISQNSDYFVLFKNPRNSSEIRTLATQITPGNLSLVNIYMEATKEPFSYLFINLTQEVKSETKYLSDLFKKDHVVKAYLEKH